MTTESFRACLGERVCGLGLSQLDKPCHLVLDGILDRIRASYIKVDMYLDWVAKVTKFPDISASPKFNELSSLFQNSNEGATSIFSLYAEIHSHWSDLAKSIEEKWPAEQFASKFRGLLQANTLLVSETDRKKINSGLQLIEIDMITTLIAHKILVINNTKNPFSSLLDDVIGYFQEGERSTYAFHMSKSEEEKARFLTHAATFYQALITATPKISAFESCGMFSCVLKVKFWLCEKRLLHLCKPDQPKKEKSWIAYNPLKKLSAIRKDLSEKIQSEEVVKSDNKFAANMEQIEKETTQKITDLFYTIIKNCKKVIPALKYKHYNFVLLGSWLKASGTPYSDIEFVCLTSTKADEYVKKYIQLLTYLISMKVLKIGESVIPKSHRAFRSGLEELGKMGFCLDLGGKTPIGRIWDKKRDYTLINSPNKMVELIDCNRTERTKFLAPMLVQAALSNQPAYGDRRIFEKFRELVHKKCNKLRRNSLGFDWPLAADIAYKMLQENTLGYKSDYEQCKSLDINQASFHVKRDLYRPICSLIENQTLLSMNSRNSEPIASGTIWDQARICTKYCPEKAKDELLYHLSSVLKLRYVVYNCYKKFENLVHIKSNEDTDFTLSHSEHQNLQSSIGYIKEFAKRTKKLLKAKSAYWSARSWQIKGNSQKAIVQCDIAQKIYSKLYETDKCPDIKEVLQLSNTIKLQMTNTAQTVNKPEKTPARIYDTPGDSQEATATHYSVPANLVEQGKLEEAKSYLQQALEDSVEIYCTRKHPEVAIIIHNIGFVLQEQGKLEEAKSYLQQALNIKTEIYGRRHPQVATTMHMLGIVLQEQGKLEEAKSYLQQALNIKTEIYGTRHFQVATTIGQLGVVLQEQGKLKEAKSYLTQALDIETEACGAISSPQMVKTIHNIGVVLFKQNKLKEAQSYLKRALDIETKEYGAISSPQMVKTIQGLGIVLQEQWKLEEAQKFFQDLLEIFTQLYGTRMHPEVASTIHQLGTVIQGQGKLKEAQKLFQDVLDIFTQLYGTRIHPNTAKAIYSLGTVLQEQGKFEEAQKLFQDVLEISTQVYGVRKHPNVGKVICSLGTVLQEQGKFEEAQKHYEEALEIFTQVYKTTRKHPKTRKHPEVAKMIHNLGTILLLQDKLGEAQMHLQEALEIFTQVYKTTRKHPDVAKTIHSLGAVLQEQGKFEEAQKHYEEALEIFTQVHETRKHPDVAKTIHSLGTVLQEQGMFEEAQKHYEEALEIFVQVHETRKHPDVAKTIHQLGTIFQEQGMFEEAQKHYEEALEIFTQVHETRKHPDVAKTIHQLGAILQKQSKLEEAQTHFQDALNIKTKVYSTRHPQIAKTARQLGIVLEGQGKLKEAKRHFREALEIYAEANDTRGHSQVAQTTHNLGSVQFNQNNYNFKALEISVESNGQCVVM